jgi:hypothetical protein
MQAVVVVIAAEESPILADLDPAGTSPAPLDPESIQMATDSTTATPGPPIGLVVVIVLPLVPICAHTAPVAVVVALENAQAISVETDAPVLSPDPASATM